MALQTQSKTIGEHEYVVTQLDAVKGRRVFVRFMKLLAPVVGSAADAEARKGKNPESVMAEALAEMVKNLTEEDFDVFCEAFAPSTSVTITDDNGKQRSPKLSDIFRLHFAGKYDEMVAWLYFCIEVNFGSFFARVGQRPAT